MSAAVLGVHAVTISELGGSSHVAKGRKTGVQILSQEEQLASQLGHLASLHHASEYSRMKFGPKGSPSTYIPLCIHMPDHFKELQEQQAIRATQRAWWKAQEAPKDVPMKEVSQDISGTLREKSPTLSRPASSVDLQRDLLNAMSSPLTSHSSSVPVIPPDCRVKTSESHPINLSAIIPSEVMQLIASHLRRSGGQLPVVFDVPPSLCLHILVAQLPPSPGPPLAKPNYPSAPSNLRPITSTHSRVPFHLTKPPGFVNLLWSQNFWRKAIGSSHIEVPNGTKNFAPTSASAIPGQPVKVSRSPSFKGWKPASKRTASGSVISGSKPQPSEPQHVSKPTSTRAPESAFALEFPILSPQIDAHGLKKDQADPEFLQKSDEVVILGNLFLSSCPGKKVRLHGPNRGRSAVCRDLALDLRRIRGLGVRCIVCFLDDDELEFLGAPWPEYSLIAEEIGLDVLRLPTPEGLAPLDAQALDSHLTSLIETYTLKGLHVLVHCRGGVGRAGLFACCWILKLGLCGWVERESRRVAPAPSKGSLDFALPSGNSRSERSCRSQSVKSDTLQLVEKILSVVRKQRSPKAVETYEQVKFLVGFVEYLRKNRTGKVPPSLISE